MKNWGEQLWTSLWDNLPDLRNSKVFLKNFDKQLLSINSAEGEWEEGERGGGGGG